MSMAVVQKKSESTVAGAQARVSLTTPNIDTVKPVGIPLIQRKSICACGGSCPSCLAKDESIQPKLKIGSPNDKYEQEADRVAEQVMRMPEPKVQRQAMPEEEKDMSIQAKLQENMVTPVIQRMASDNDEEEEVAQRKVATSAASYVPARTSNDIQSLRGGGQPLARSARGFFEPRIGADFSSVRVHNDARAAQAAQAVNARAFTLGHDVVFNRGEYSPETISGKKLLAHELTHVVQQARGATAPHIQRRDWGLLGGKGCNESPEGDEWALVGDGSWQRLSQGECTGSFTDCDGMTCGGGFYYISNLQTGICRTPRRDDATYRPRRWTPDNPRPGSRSPEDRGSSEGNTPPGYAYDLASGPAVPPVAGGANPVLSIAKDGNMSMGLWPDGSTNKIGSYQMTQNFRAELDPAANAADFTVIQWIKGEMYENRGGSRVYWPATMGLYGRSSSDPWLFSDWIIDSPDADPRLGSNRGVSVSVPTTTFADSPGVIMSSGRLPAGHHWEVDARVGIYRWGPGVPVTIGGWESQRPAALREVNWGWTVTVNPDQETLSVNVR